MFSIWKTLNRYGTSISNFGANFKNGHFSDFDGIRSELVYRVIDCVDFVSDVYFILKLSLGGRLDHSKFRREIQNFVFFRFSRL